MKTKTNLLLALMLISFAPMLHAQDFWERIAFPDSVTIRCMALNQQGHIFVGTGCHGETGGVYRSRDDGQSWECVYDNQNHGVLSIGMNSKGHIYVGKNGFDVLIYSENNGEDWISLHPPLEVNIVKIFCVGVDTVFISQWASEGPFVAYSYDRGKNWDSTYMAAQLEPYVSDIAIDNNGCLYAGVHGYYSGDGGLYKSEDWGKSWNYIGLVNHQVNAVAVNSNNEVFTGDWSASSGHSQISGVYAMYEGSDTFELIMESVEITDIAIAENDDIYMTAYYWTLASYDNGQSFTVLAEPFQSSAREMVFAENGHIYGYSTSFIVKSTEPVITAVQENGNSFKDQILSLYPNPISKYLNLAIVGHKNTEPIYVELIDSEGREVYKQTFISSDKMRLDLGHLPVGLYFARVRTNKELLYRKFIKR